MRLPNPEAELVQRAGLWKRITFRLYRDRLHLEHRSFLDATTLAVPLEVLKETPDELRGRRWTHLTVVIACALLGTLLIGSAFVLPAPAGDASAVTFRCGFGGVLLFGAQVALGRWIASFDRARVLLYNSSGQPIVMMYAGRPSAPAVDAFLARVKELRDREADRLKAQETDAALGYTLELERFKKLADEKIITPEEFAEARRRLLGIERIGFGG